MELTIDKFGRVVLPKKLRERLGVGVGLKVEVKETPEGVLLKPVQPPGTGLMMKNGVLVDQGSPGDTKRIDWDKLVEDEREERIRHILEVLES